HRSSVSGSLSGARAYSHRLLLGRCDCVDTGLPSTARSIRRRPKYPFRTRVCRPRGRPSDLRRTSARPADTRTRACLGVGAAAPSMALAPPATALVGIHAHQRRAASDRPAYRPPSQGIDVCEVGAEYLAQLDLLLTERVLCAPLRFPRPPRQGGPLQRSG